MDSRMSFIIVAIGILVFFSPSPTFAASVDQSEYEKLFKVATQRGVVRVSISLDVKVSLGQSRSPALKSEIDSKAGVLFAELGDDALQVGRSINGFGQIGAYVTPQGMQKLAATRNARSFGRDLSEGVRTAVYHGDGRIEVIEAEIDTSGFADVEVTLNLENLDFDILPDGRTRLRPSSDQAKELSARLPQFVASLSPGMVLDLADVKSRIKVPAFQKPTLQLRVNREGLYALKESPQVRAIQLLKASPAQPPFLDPEALTEAARHGSVRVLMELRISAPYSPLRGNMPAKAWQAQTDAIGRAFAEITSGMQGEKLNFNEYKGLGAIALQLSESTLKALYASPDPRISAIRLSKPVAAPTLMNSIPLINMPNAWNAGFKGAGQAIVVYDTGIQKKIARPRSRDEVSSLTCSDLF